MRSKMDPPPEPPPPPPRLLADVQAALDPNPGAAMTAETAARRLETGLQHAGEALAASPAAAAGDVVAFLTFLLRRVLPAVLELDQPSILASLSEILMPGAAEEQQQQQQQQQWWWCTLVALSEALTPDADGVSGKQRLGGNDQKEQQQIQPPSLRESTDALAFVMRQLEEGFFHEEAGRCRLRAVVAELVSGQARRDAAAPVDRVLQAIALLPMRAGNALRGPAPPGLAGATVFGATAREALRLYKEEGSGGKDEPEDGWRGFWGPLVYKACKMGQAEPVARAWAEEAASWTDEDGAMSLVPLVECLPLPALEPFLVALVRVLLSSPAAAEEEEEDPARTPRALARGFGEALSRSPLSVQGQALRSLIISKLLATGGGAAAASRRPLPRRAAPLLLRLAAGSDAVRGLPPLLLTLAAAWKERRFLHAVDVELQAFVTHALESGLGMLAAAGATALEGEPGLVPALLEGVGVHLESALEPVRVQGMRVGEAFARVMGQPLRFEELDGLREGEEAGEARGAATTEQGDSRATGAEGEEEDEEGEELQAYDLSDDEADLLPVAPPKYLRRIVEYLRVKDEDGACDKHRAALQEAEALIRARPADLLDMCAALTRELLTLENRFALEEFTALRRGALVALIATAPERVAPLLAALAFDRQLSFGMRLQVLDLLMEGAQDLSQLWATHASMAITDGANNKGLLADAGPRTQGKRALVRAEKAQGSGGALAAGEPRTRRWGQRRGQAPQPKRNPFGPVAARAFFRPLVHGMALHAGSHSGQQYQQPPHVGAPPVLTASGLLLLGSRDDDDARRLYAKDNDGALAIAKTLLALACFVECAGHSPGTGLMAEELLALAWPLRESPFPELRRAVLLALAAAVAHLQVEPFLARGGAEAAKGLQAVAAWTAAVRELDADADNRRLAGAVVASQPKELAALGLCALLQELS